MKFAFDITSAVKPEPTGTGRYALELFRALLPLFAPEDQVILAYRLSRWSRRHFFPKITDPRVRVRPLQSPFARLSFGVPDVYHGLGVNVPLGLPAQTAKFVTVHGIVHQFSSSPKKIEKINQRRDKIRKMIQRADRAFVVSEFERKRTAELMECDIEKLVVVYLGVDQTLFHSSEDPEKDRAAMGTKAPSRPYFIYLGAITELKNVSGLLEAFAISKAKKDFDLVIAGPQRAGSAAILSKIPSLGLSDCVRVVGHIEPNLVPSWLRQARALVHASRYEAGAAPVIESFACGTPVACSDVAAMPEITGGVAAFFDPLDPTSIAKSIDRLAYGDKLHGELRSKGLIRSKDFTWQNSAQKAWNTYREVLELRQVGT